MNEQNGTSDFGAGKLRKTISWRNNPRKKVLHSKVRKEIKIH